MSEFEFFMTFYGLLLGLGVAELLNGFANILREKSPPRLGWLVPMLGLLILVEMIANFSDAWLNFRTLDVGLVEFAPATLIGILYYVAAVTLLPRDLGDWPSLTNYFFQRRRWIVGALLLANLLVTLVSTSRTIPLVSAFGVAGWGVFALFLSWLFGAYLILLISNRTRLSIGAIGALLLYFLCAYNGGATLLLAGTGATPAS